MDVPVVLALVGVLCGWGYKRSRLPPPKICGTPGGPPVTSPRVRLSYGRRLAYRETGVPKEKAEHKLIIIHGYGLFLYLLPRSAVASLVAPFVHYWWSGVPQNVSNTVFDKVLYHNKWGFRVACYTPRLFYFWMRQKLFPTLSFGTLCEKDMMMMLKKLSEIPVPGEEKATQQGDTESLYRDIIVGYADWEFRPLDLTNPFPNNEGSVHIWQGYDDRLIPYEINQYVADKLSWIQYHEIHDGGHMIFYGPHIFEQIVKALVLKPAP